MDRFRLLALLTLAVLTAAPVFANDYILSVLILFLMQAYLGMAWNVMMGFAGQFSLGHALYVGLGAYSASALFVHFGLSPWLGMLVAAVVSAAFAAVIGFLGFRFGVKGVYFALLTIAFAEFTRISFDHWDWVGSSSGLFLPVTNRASNDVWLLRGNATMFYFVILAMCAAVLALCSRLLRSRLGYFWQAVREDQEAAETLGVPVFRTKMAAVLVSAALTSLAGVFYAFYTNTLYPESIFSMHRSIELMLGTIVGGIGTLAGPILGAAVLTLLGEALTIAGEGTKIDGIKQVAYGLMLLVIVAWKPSGLWPWLAARLRLGDKR